MWTTGGVGFVLLHEDEGGTGHGAGVGAALCGEATDELGLTRTELTNERDDVAGLRATAPPPCLTRGYRSRDAAGECVGGHGVWWSQPVWVRGLRLAGGVEEGDCRGIGVLL